MNSNNLKEKQSKNGENLNQPSPQSSSLSNLPTSLTKFKNTGDAGENLWNVKDVVAYAEKKIGVKLDKWQKDYINTKGNVAIRAGRQSGKSFAQSLRVALFALLNEKTQTLIIGAVDRQSVELFEKVKSHILVLAKHQIKGKPTLHRIELRNGSRIIALPAGRTGYGLRNYTIHKLVADEAHYIPEEVWTAVRPMLATTGGTMDILSTPRGNEGFFYEAFNSPDFTTYHTTSEECPRIDKNFLAQERKRMTKLQYAQEYLAEFLDSLQQFFPKDLINACLDLNLLDKYSPSLGKAYYLGVDVARYGGDENAFVVCELVDNESLTVRYIETTERISTADTMGRIQALQNIWHFQKIYIDDGGIGGAVLDVLLERPEIKNFVVGINNASRPVDADKSRGKKILKEDLYGNLRRCMEQGLIKLPDHDRLIQSLMSIQFEYTDQANLKIYGRYSHLTEALIRAAWCVKTKKLKAFAYSF